ncbi:hypothetical protein B0H10DRAFT_2233848 [Mycena sp. CBHHK59/15]|nr:hypothetical protein B0H10DRAFT_2233848 [Mycena sp. CBHHK59/15]
MEPDIEMAETAGGNTDKHTRNPRPRPSPAQPPIKDPQIVPKSASPGTRINMPAPTTPCRSPGVSPRSKSTPQVHRSSPDPPQTLPSVSAPKVRPFKARLAGSDTLSAADLTFEERVEILIAEIHRLEGRSPAGQSASPVAALGSPIPDVNDDNEPETTDFLAPTAEAPLSGAAVKLDVALRSPTSESGLAFARLYSVPAFVM